eukprot:maker-scaffold37_size504123-snap-gene-0.8 protein:Tk07370 transcript:maker-scaffold37_size504123-snap-gene-0.8-mRNA-1 annotation:"hypothetical protein DAPPUDRAFT_119154"
MNEIVECESFVYLRKETRFGFGIIKHAYGIVLERSLKSIQIFGHSGRVLRRNRRFIRPVVSVPIICEKVKQSTLHFNMRTRPHEPLKPNQAVRILEPRSKLLDKSGKVIL